MRKKFVYSFLAVFLIFSLGACSEKTKEAPDTNKSESKETHSKQTAHWSYEGETGPEHWGELDQANATCVDGSEQSPINIEFSQVITDKKTENIQIQYEPTPFTLVNNGHTVQANAKTESNSILVEGNKYKLAQFHFHTPSEHQFNGQHYDMELHLVHKDANGKIAVLGVMIQEGEKSEKLASIWDVLPKEETREGIPVKEPIDLQGILPQDQRSFHYNGSLTTPPCTEEVKWVIFEEPIEMSKEQIQAFQQIFPDNHRPVQSSNDREIYETK
ncbi:carbonic anhydrase [Pseudalkalibacillus salsuginis]|uniref:carbonic anhydrase n=1 Tax=Pseudalkalibacillus salsuginis TaxID=2910972 RepID=UPI001F259D3A|nr:carbonic anhydrase family protein [Pseudalkalibacillus salsuginis]MCF6410773.1 carbonic anhydrase family protein [Pseudalkalibacillus salsuginis]